MMITRPKYGAAHREVSMIHAKNTLGEYGKEVLSTDGDVQTTGQYYFRQIQILSNAKFSTIHDNEAAEGHIEQLEDVEIPAGVILYGKFWGLTITQGIAICYKEKYEEFAEEWPPVEP